MSVHSPDHVGASRVCTICDGRGTVYTWDFDCSKVTAACPACRPKDARLDAARAALAREFGRDRTPKRPTWRDPRLADTQLSDAELLRRADAEEGAVDDLDLDLAL